MAYADDQQKTIETGSTLPVRHADLDEFALPNERSVVLSPHHVYSAFPIITVATSQIDASRLVANAHSLLRQSSASQRPGERRWKF